MPVPNSRWRDRLRRAAGAVWLAAWCGVLWAVASPWRNLGGLEPERLRWLECWALSAGVALGFAMGRGAREWRQLVAGRTRAAAIRFALYPPGLVAAMALIALSIAGERGPTGVVATAFLSYWAGFDAAFFALPLIENDPHDDAEARTFWDRF